MRKKDRVLRERPPRDQPKARNLRPKKEHISPHQIQSAILKDESLPTERSLQIDKSMVQHLDSVAASAEHIRPRRLLDEYTDVSSIAMTSGWTKYLDQTYHLRSANKSQTSVSGGSSLIEQSRNSEELLKSPDKQPHFLRQRKNVVQKGVGAEVFGAAFTSPKAQISSVSLSQPKRVGEISVEGLEETSPVLSQPFKRRKNIKANPSAFEEAFKDFILSATDSAHDVADRLEESRQMSAVLSALALQSKKSVNEHVDTMEQEINKRHIELASPSKQTKDTNMSAQALKNNKPRNEHTDTLEQESDTPSISASFNKRHSELAGPSRQTKDARFSAQAIENNKPRNEHTDTLEQESDTPSRSASFNKRHTELAGPSRQTKDARLSDQAIQNNKSRNEHVDTLEQESDTPSRSASFNKRHSELAGPSRQTKDARLSAQTIQNNKSRNEHVDTLEQESDTPSRSASFNKRHTELAGPSRQTKDARLSDQAIQNNKSRNEHVDTLEQESDTPSRSASFNERHSELAGPTRQTNDARLSAQALQNNRSKNEHDTVKQELDTPSGSASFNKRHSELAGPSRQTMDARLSAQGIQNNKSKNEHVDTLEQESDTPSRSASFNKRHSELAGPSRQTKDTRLSAQAIQNNRSKNEHVDTVEQESDTPSRSASFNKRHSKLAGPSRQTKDTRLSAQAVQNSKSRNEHVDTVEQELDTPSRSASFNKRHPELKSMAILSGPSSHSGEKEWRKIGNSGKQRQSTSNRSIKPQNVPWFRQWQETAAASRKTCAFNLLPREERSAKLEELVTEVKRKQDETLKADLMKSPFISKPDEPENMKVILPVNKKKVSLKPSRPDLLVNGKPYRPRLRRPKSWATPRLYKLIIPKCEKKYGILKARCKAEEFVIFLCEKVSTVIRRKKYEKYKGVLEEIKRALYELGVINCLMEYFVFIEDYLPFEYRIKAIPCLRAYGQHTGPPLTPGVDLFADLGY